jgi:hypothetical protein
MTFNGTPDGWDLIVSPWHLDEHIPAWAVPAGATALVRASIVGSQAFVLVIANTAGSFLVVREGCGQQGGEVVADPPR